MILFTLDRTCSPPYGCPIDVLRRLQISKVFPMNRETNRKTQSIFTRTTTNRSSFIYWSCFRRRSNIEL